MSLGERLQNHGVLCLSGLYQIEQLLRRVAGCGAVADHISLDRGNRLVLRMILLLTRVNVAQLLGPGPSWLERRACSVLLLACDGLTRRTDALSRGHPSFLRGHAVLVWGLLGDWIGCVWPTVQLPIEVSSLHLLLYEGLGFLSWDVLLDRSKLKILTAILRK